mgnify:CR=1 FL=1
MRRSCTSPTALISGSFFSEEATAVDAPAPGISVAVVGTVVVVVVGTAVVVVVGTAVVVVAGTSVVVGTAVVVVVGTAVVVVAGTAVVVVAGTSVVVGTSMEMSESGASLLHVTAVAYIETTPRQTTTFVDR